MSLISQHPGNGAQRDGAQRDSPAACGHSSFNSEGHRLGSALLKVGQEGLGSPDGKRSKPDTRRGSCVCHTWPRADKTFAVGMGGV